MRSRPAPLLAVLLLSFPLFAAAQQASRQVFGNGAISAHLQVHDRHLLIQSIEAGGNVSVLKPGMHLSWSLTIIAK